MTVTVKEFMNKYGLTGPQACVLLGYTTPQHLQRVKNSGNVTVRSNRLKIIMKINVYLLKFYTFDQLIKIIKKEKDLSLPEILEKYKINDVDDGTKLFGYSCLKSFMYATNQTTNKNSSLIQLIKLVNILFKRKLNLKEIFEIIERR